MANSSTKTTMSSPPSNSEPAAFELLAEGVRRWLWEQRWTGLRDVQDQAIHTILETDSDLLIAAGTATGKTEAAFLPIVSRLCTDPPESLGAIYIGPLKALINDQFRRLEELCATLDVPVHRWHGDVGQGPKKRMLKEPRGILLITPESLEALFMLRGSDCSRLFAGLAHVVIDEMHSFIGSERGTQLQSLLHRIEAACGHNVVRVGLSATLGDMDLAARFLRPGKSDAVERLVSERSGGELRLSLRGYEQLADSQDSTAIAENLFENLRGTNNLIFANSRTDVELYADSLRHLCDEAGLPNEFHPHHGSLSRELREALEASLKASGVPITAVCTTTMEMGIDLGSVACVAQIGAPSSVASLRQRLGRSGRRGEAAVLRLYIREPEIEFDTPFEWKLRPELVQTIAIVELMLERWCEPPEEGGLRLSTLVQQTLSVIAQANGAKAGQLWKLLCETGPFRSIDSATYADFLRDLGAADLITQMHEGTLVLGVEGEKLAGSYEFFAAFEAAEQIQLQSGARSLGTMPVTGPLVPGSAIVFAGRRWRILEVRRNEKVCLVEPAAGGKPPVFRGEVAPVHGVVRRKMREIWSEANELRYLDEGAAALLAQGRSAFNSAGLADQQVIPDSNSVLFFPWCSDRIAHTIALWLHTRDLKVECGGLYLRIAKLDTGEFFDLVSELVDEGEPEPDELIACVPNALTGKHSLFLSEELAARDYASLKLDTQGAFEVLKLIR